MNMKKVLAVVMAVMLAISAMAISVFAAEYEIKLSSAGSKGNGVAYSTVEFTIPVWAQYGYAVAGDSIKLSLPAAEGASYVVVANGVSYALGLNADGVYEIVFGTLAHGWNDRDLNTVIPQSTVVGDNAALTVIGTFKILKDADGKETYRVSAYDFTLPGAGNWTMTKFTAASWNWSNGSIGDIKYDVKAVSNDNPNSVSYCWDWNPVNGADIAASDSTWNAGLTNLHWDATLINKAQVIGAETAKVVVKLDKAIVGNYYFGLLAKYANGYYYNLPGANFPGLGNETKNYAAYIEIEAPTDTITFEVPKEVLYSTNYGAFNESFDVVCVDATHEDMLWNIKGYELVQRTDSVGTTVLKKDKGFMDGNATKTAWENNENVTYTLVQTVAGYRATTQNGTLGDYSWTKDTISYCGQEINIYWNQWYNVAPQSVTLVLGYTDVETPADDIVVEDPVESTEEESEDITVEEPVEDTNPGTGLALAVVPMVLAAAAVVASKRR